MTPQQWFESVNGKYIEVAGSANAKNQCVDCANDYIKRVLGLPYIEWTNAINFPQQAGDKYEFIWNTPEALPVEGALMIFDIGEVGHISVFLEGNLALFRSMDQNYPIGSPCCVVQHNYSKVIGWLIPKSSIIDDMTDEQNKVLNKLESYQKEAKHSSLEGAMDALIGNVKELQISKESISNLKRDIEKLELNIKDCITKEECEKQIQTLQNNFNEDKDKWEVKKEEDITKAIETAIKESDEKWQEKTKDYDKIKESSEYKFAEFLFKLLHLTKKESE
jgi:hypothetical protein